jgi:opacity protein-like surface antigen
MTISVSRKGLAASTALGTAAVSALLPAGQASAQSTGLEGMKVTVDGGIGFNDFTQDTFSAKGFEEIDFDRDLGFFGSVALSRSFSEGWDWRVSGSYLGLRENDETVVAGSASLTIGNRVSGLTIDADVGRTLSQGDTEIRLGFGLLHARYDQDVDFALFSGGKGIGFDTDVSYRGTGVKLSADVAHPVSEDGRTKLIGGISLAPTKGDFNITTPILPGGQDIDGDALLTTVYLGMSMQQTENTELRFGLRVERFDGEANEFFDSGDSFGIINEPLTTPIAFVGMRVEF